MVDYLNTETDLDDTLYPAETGISLAIKRNIDGT